MQLWAESVEVNCKQPVKCLVFYIHYFKSVIVSHSFLNVAVNDANVFCEVDFLDCLHCFFDGVRGTFHRFYGLN